MKLPVTTASPDPAALWRRWADLLFDRALAGGEELEMPQGRAAGGEAVDWFFPAAAVTLDDGDALAPFRQRRRPLICVEPPGLSSVHSKFSHSPTSRNFTLYRLLRAAATGELPATAVLPGRAARDGYTQLCVQCYAETTRPMDAQLATHLDDPHFDPLIVLDHGQPIAMAGLQTRGQTGGLFDLYVVPRHRRRGLGTQLIGRILELAARSQHVDLFAACETDQPANRLLTKAGFVAVTSYAVWTVDAAAASDA